MPSRSYKGEMKYRAIKKTMTTSAGCRFCGFQDQSRKDEILENHKYFWLVKNIFPYHIWDDQNIEDHIMLVPKRHIISIGDMNDDELLEYSKVIGKYDKLGYSVYARSAQNTLKSIPHQHSHLLKLDNKEITFMVYNKKPYVLIKR